MSRRRQIHYQRAVFWVSLGVCFPPTLNSVRLLIIANQAGGRGTAAPGGSAAAGKSFFASFPSCRDGKPKLCGIFGPPLQLVVLGASLLTLP